MVLRSGEVCRYPSRQVSGEKVFQSDRESFEYVLKLASSDVQYGGFREDRVLTFQLKQEANFLLFEKVRSCDDPHRYEAYRQAWELNNRPKLRDFQWSPEQKEAIDLIKAGLSHEDENERADSNRWLYVNGPPGSGKSAVLLHLAVWASQFMQVLIICPTGLLVHQHKSRIPEQRAHSCGHCSRRTAVQVQRSRL